MVGSNGGPTHVGQQWRSPFALPWVMSDRIDFEIVCPNDHDQTVTFSREGFEEALKTGALVFHCNTCDTDWPPSHEDIARIRKVLSKVSS